MEEWFENQMITACSVDYCTTNYENNTYTKCQKCSFPFSYEGKVYNECAKDVKSPDGLEKPWCSTLSKLPGGPPYKKNWGYCHDNCLGE